MINEQYTSPSYEAAKRLRRGVLPHVPPPASPISTRVRLDLEIESDPCPEAVIVDPKREHGWQVALSRGERPGTWYTEILLPQEPTRIRYHFVLPDGTIIRERRQVEGASEPLFGVWEEVDFRIAAYDPKGPPPDWVAGSVLYQIFPDRFATGDPENVRKGGDVYGREPLYMKWGEPPEHKPRSRDFFGGDLRGVIQKLDYLRDLGITCIYFTPIFESPSNHRYDTINYFKIDPRLGTEEDLKELIEKAADRGIRILLDGVFNHCSSESIYFKAARADRLSPYYRWFSFTEWPDSWEGWLGVKTMPELVECPEVEEFFFGTPGVANYWLALGTAGWRTDVTPWITDEYWRRFRRAVRREYPDAYLIAEDWGDATHRLLGDSFDATMNYRFGYSAAGFADRKLTPAELDDRLETLRRDTPLPNFHAQMNLLDSHDTARVYTKLGKDKAKMMLAVGVQFAYPGVPTVFSGDEAGVEGSYAESARGTFPWGHEDPDLMAFYHKVIAVRRRSSALSLGGVETMYIDEEGGYGFLRRMGSEAVLCLFNNSKRPLHASVALPEGAPEGEWPDMLEGVPAGIAEGGALKAQLPPLGMGWFKAPLRVQKDE